MLKFTYRLFNWIERNIVEPVVCRLGRSYLAAAGVSFGKGLMLYGIPLACVHRNSRVVIGDQVSLRSRSKGNAIGVNHEVILRTQAEGAVIRVGNRVGMSGGAICAIRKVEIGDDVLIGANVVIADNDFHPVDASARKRRDANIRGAEVVIGNNVWIGADSYICKGVTIGENSIIGAKSVVTKSVPGDCVAAGNPARVVKMLESADVTAADTQHNYKD
jgi:acetyltransferase-like isoleucine patch superfamily enzyme